jgi:hypothetical protein
MTTKRLKFIEKLGNKLTESGIGKVESGDLGDNSGRFVVIQKGSVKIEFGFDMKGELITDILIVEDEYTKVGERVIFSFTKK